MPRRAASWAWQPQREPPIADTMIRTLVRQQGQALREAEHAEALELLARPDLATLTPALATACCGRSPAAATASWCAAGKAPGR
ncbi:MAG: hypothetical protein HXY37_06885 [Chloroflexi bacterium]|nr:hypothetical protein [Chloroflexota bacterium]